MSLPSSSGKIAVSPEELVQGATVSWERLFTVEDVSEFAALTGDVGRHHLKGDVLGRVMVHGLLTASLATKIGGDLNFIAKEMNLEFLLPVYTGDSVRCTLKVTSALKDARVTRLALEMSCANQLGKEVVKGTIRGLILNEGA